MMTMISKSLNVCCFNCLRSEGRRPSRVASAVGMMILTNGFRSGSSRLISIFPVDSSFGYLTKERLMLDVSVFISFIVDKCNKDF